MNGHGTQPEDALTWYDDRTPLPYSPPTPSNVEGYEFKGWEPSEIPVGSRTDIVFNAKWEVQKQTVTFLSNGGFFEPYDSYLV